MLLPAAVLLAGLLAACSGESLEEQVCSDRLLNVGFYAYFAPVSHSADPNPGSLGFNTHLGYESDLLTALEAMPGGNLAFSRSGIAEWDGIWLRSGAPEYDLIGGGITILDSRTKDPSGNKVVSFTSGHIAFRQSLLVRSEDAGRWSSHAKLTSKVRVGALAGTTGESRLLELTGLVDADGVLVPGVRVETENGTVVADGTSGYFITAAGASGNLQARKRLHPPSESMPQVVYLGEDAGERDLLAALESGAIDALARGAVGNSDAAQASNGTLAVTALDNAVEYGGFTYSVGDTELGSCLDERINWLTDNRRIGYPEWLENPSVFMQRARRWESGS